MDPVSQGLIGAVLPQSLSNKKEIRLAAAIGFLSGLLADIDVVVRSSTDPLLFLDYHRQFTHSLVFIPIGGLVAAGFCWLFLKKHLSFWKIYIYAFLGYGTHCFLDACTSYGTQLLWPFSDARVAWNVVSIIDPIFTFTLVFLVIIAAVRKSPLIARIGLLFAIIYLLCGLYQRERAEDVLIALAQSRGHKVERTLVHPSIGNLLVWRSIYESNGNYYVDAVRVGLFSEPKIYNGGSIKVFDPIQELTGLDPNSVLYGDINRFRRFAKDFLVVHPQYPDIIGDLRMGIFPNSIKPIWGIKFSPDKENEHVSMDNYERSVNGEKIQTFISMLLGRDIMSNKVQQRE
jgi:inner membrane protein